MTSGTASAISSGMPAVSPPIRRNPRFSAGGSSGIGPPVSPWKKDSGAVGGPENSRKVTSGEGSRQERLRNIPLRVLWLTGKTIVKLGFQLVGEVLGFGLGLGLGLAATSFVLSCRRSLEVEVPQVKRIVDITHEEELHRLLQDVPEWVKSPGLERVGWINAIVAKAWPHINVVSVDIFKKNVWPFVKEKFVECGMSVKFISMSFGDFPPTFDSVKAVETLGDECIIETTVKFATNASLICEVGAFGGVTVAQMSEVHATGLCRITLTPLTAQFPCFAGVKVSLMDKLQVDAKVTALGGLDLLTIPRVKPLVLSALHSVLADYLLWPRHLLVPLQHEALAGTRHAIGTVTLIVVGARGLVYQGLGLPAPYVKVSMDENRSARTTSKESTCTPHWDEQLMLAVDDREKDVLQIKVMDYDAVFRDSLLGTVTLPVNTLVPNQTKKMALELRSKASRLFKSNNVGLLEVDATFRLFQHDAEDPLRPPADGVSIPSFPMKPAPGVESGLLEVFVRRGMNLESHKDRNARTFCKILIGSDARKTRLVQHMADPQWDEEFEFLFGSPPIHSKLRVEIWHNGDDMITLLTTSRRLLGYVEIRLKDVVDNQRIRDVYQLNQAKQGQILLEMIWLQHKSA